MLYYEWYNIYIGTEGQLTPLFPLQIYLRCRIKVSGLYDVISIGAGKEQVKWAVDMT